MKTPKIHRYVLPCTAVAVAALLVTPRESEGFSTLGFSLPLAQRDNRVFDNFSDASANNNVTPDANWPGYTGAELSIWKACVEWGSRLHGNGNGDPHQVGGLGSGNANFDITWQGNATGIGTINENIHSEVGGDGGGVLAYTESPDASGWRIRYYQNPWIWQDGPDTAVGFGNNIDLQGVACHEYGHALGLNHSNVNGATMYPSISGNGVVARSIAADDILGVQAIYGVAAGVKPIISNVSGTSTLTITGSNFAAANNEVWFTQSGVGGTGQPVKVLAVSSSGGGTSITVNVPVGAGPGDVLVKSSAGSGGDDLSNAWPVDPQANPPCTTDVASFCTAKMNSASCIPYMDWIGDPSFSAGSGFDLRGLQVLDNKPGLLYYSVTGPGGGPFQGGFSCATAPTKRTPLQTSNGLGQIPCTGIYSLDFNVRIASGIDPALVVGQQVWSQYWTRDGGSASGTGLTDGVTFVICD